MEMWATWAQVCSSVCRSRGCTIDLMAPIHNDTLPRTMAEQMPQLMYFTHNDDEDQAIPRCPLWSTERQTSLLVWTSAPSESHNSPGISSCAS